MEVASDAAYTDLVSEGENSIIDMDDTMSSLIDEDVTIYQTALAVKLKKYLLSGLAPTRLQTRDVAILTIIDEAVASTDERSLGVLSAISNRPQMANLLLTVKQARPILLDTSDRVTPQEVLNAHHTVDNSLPTNVAFIYFDVFFNSDFARK